MTGIFCTGQIRIPLTSQSNNLLYFDLETGKALKTNPDYYLGKYAAAASRLYVQTTGLYIVPSGASYVDPADTASRITISDSELTLLQGGEYTLTTAVYPWTLVDKSVTWTTSDASIATVEDGRVEGSGRWPGGDHRHHPRCAKSHGGLYRYRGNIAAPDAERPDL